MGHLTEAQRYIIFAELQAGSSRKKICELIGHDKSVLSRELRRNQHRRTGKYNPDLAQRKYEKRLHEKPKHLYFTEDIKTLVIKGLEEDWSPEQIVGRSKIDGINCVSHERIYQFVWSDKKLKDKGLSLYKHLRNRGRKYAKRGACKSSRGIIKDRVSIDERPKEVDEKKRFGDIEIDTMIGKNHKSAIFTATDRATSLEWIVKLPLGKNAQGLANEVNNKLLPVKDLLHTATSDNGKEFAEHRQISEFLGIDFYFAHPYKSCERG